MESREHIECLVKEGLVADIFKAEQAYALLRVSGDRADEINDVSRGNFGSVFGALQAALTTEAALATARIFDNPHPRFPTRCMKGLLAYLVEHAERLPKIREPHQLRVSLARRPVPETLLASATQSHSAFPQELSTYATEQMKAAALDQSIARLRTLRNKGLAHNERTGIRGPTWSGVLQLLDLAKYVVGALGWAYFNIAYTANGEYILTQDAEAASRGLSRLLDQLYRGGPAA